jgi:hypothetical protein
MRHILMTLLLVVAPVVGVVAANSGGEPDMVFERTEHNFGDVKRKGGDVIAMFRFVNRGDAPLVIKKVHKSCSCMDIDFSRKPVLPNEGGEIKVKYEPHKVEPGIFNKVIQIYTNEPRCVRLITIQGNSIDK